MCILFLSGHEDKAITLATWQPNHSTGQGIKSESHPTYFRSWYVPHEEDLYGVTIAMAIAVHPSHNHNSETFIHPSIHNVPYPFTDFEVSSKPQRALT